MQLLFLLSTVTRQRYRPLCSSLVKSIAVFLLSSWIYTFEGRQTTHRFGKSHFHFIISKWIFADLVARTFFLFPICLLPWNLAISLKQNCLDGSFQWKIVKQLRLCAESHHMFCKVVTRGLKNNGSPEDWRGGAGSAAAEAAPAAQGGEAERTHHGPAGQTRGPHQWQSNRDACEFFKIKEPPPPTDVLTKKGKELLYPSLTIFRCQWPNWVDQCMTS